MNARDLIETAHGLTELSPRRPSQANLRRAQSTAYYAVFHSLAAIIADALMGKGRGDAWHQTYRALEHGSARKACQNMQAMREFPLEIQNFAETFKDLQGARRAIAYGISRLRDSGLAAAVAQFWGHERPNSGLPGLFLGSPAARDRQFSSRRRHIMSKCNRPEGARNRADYALDGRYDKPGVLAQIGRAEAAIAWLEGADVQHRRRFAAHVLFKRRS